MLKKITRKIFIAFILFSASETSFAGEHNQDFDQFPLIENIDKWRTWVELRANIKRVDRESIKQLVSNAYQGYRLVSTCIGTYRDEGKVDVAVALVDAKQKTGVYAVLLQVGTANYEIAEIAKSSISFTEKGVMQPWMEVSCKSWTSITRLIENYKNSPGSVSLKPINHYDVACTVPLASTEDFACYGYNAKKNKFEDIGGWSNE